MTKLFYSFVALLLFTTAACQSDGRTTAAAVLSDAQRQQLDTATFAGGCFWCTEAIFERVEGVEEVVSGYAGGEEPNPTYQQVSAGRTSHAEAVQVYYDPARVSYATLVEVFFATHNPTTLNRQGPDVGAQYRSVAFYRTDAEAQQIREHVAELEAAGKYDDPIVTEVVAIERFYPAEDYHQDYYEHHPGQPYVLSVTRPKVLKFEKQYKKLLKAEYL